MHDPPTDTSCPWAATAVTLLGLGLALAAAASALDGRVAEGFVFLIGAGLADLFDGWIARRTGTAGRAMGIQLDSLVDVASFGVVPVVLVSAEVGAAPGSGIGFLTWAVGWIYVSCAVLRLARFNVTAASESGPVRSYRGLPVTYAALVFPVAFAAAESIPGVDTALVLLAATGVQAVLFVLPVPIPKPRGFAYLFFLVLAVLVGWFLMTGLA